MSKIEELIQQYCPDGVEYVKLKDIGILWYRGAGIKKDEITTDGIPCIRYGEIHTRYSIWFDECVSHTDENKQATKKYAECGDILFAITSEDIPMIGNSVAYIGKEKILVGGDIVVMRHKQNPKYLSYALSTVDAVKQKGKGKVKSKVVHTSVPSLQEIEIPLPPLPVQEEIVRILDTFTGLQKELEAELQARQLQYQFYRDKLLSFEGRSDVEWKKLKDLCTKWCSGGTPTKGKKEFYENGNIPWLRTQDVQFNEIFQISSFITELAIKQSSAKWIPENCVIVAISGATAGRCAINKIKCATNQHCFNMQIEPQKALYKYVFYCVCNQYDELIAKKQGARGDLNSSAVLGLEIPIPSLEEQERIVAILDRFDSLVNDLSKGLPAEIEARKQQYEYYRDKLLDFKRR